MSQNRIQIAVLYDYDSKGSGHRRRAEHLVSRYRQIGLEASCVRLDSNSKHSAFWEQGDALQELPTHIIVDSYQPAHHFDPLINFLNNPPVMQVIDHSFQSRWASWFLDPFSTLRASPQVFQGLEYAITCIDTGVRPWSEQESSERVILSVGASDPFFLEALLQKVAARPLYVASPKPLDFDPQMIRRLWFTDQLEFLKEMSQARFVISNCGVTGLQRFALGVPGFAVVTEQNQKDAALAIKDAGATVHEDVETMLAEMSLRGTDHHHFRAIGSSLDVALRQFVGLTSG